MRAQDVFDLYRDEAEIDGISLSRDEIQSLFQHLQLVRRRGYSVSAEEVEKGIITVSAPIRHEWLRPLSAISLSGPVLHRRTITDPRSVELLLDARDAIEREILAADDASDG